MRILQLCSPSTGGIGRHVRTLTGAIPGAVAVADPVTAAEFGFRPATKMQMMRYCAMADIVHAHGLRAAALAAVTSKKLVVTVHTLPPRDNKTRVLAGILGARATRVEAVSNDAVELLRAYGCPAELTPMASELASSLVLKPVPTNNQRQMVCSERGYKRPLIVTIARNAPEKRIDRACAAASLNVGATHIVVGPGQEKNATLAQQYPNAVFLPTSDEVEQLLIAADALLLTSDSEGAPLVVDEALAVGTPVVSTDVGIVRRQISGAGVVVNMGQDEEKIIAALAAGLKRVIGDQEEYRFRARAVAMRRPKIADVIKHWSEIYESFGNA